MGDKTCPACVQLGSDGMRCFERPCRCWCHEAVPPIEKRGFLLSPSYTMWSRSLSCSVCGRQPPSEHNHAPTRGSLGSRNDLRGHPVCRRCHVRCGGETVVVDGFAMPPVTLEQQLVLVADTFALFWERASWLVVEQVLADIRAWRESRHFVDF